MLNHLNLTDQLDERAPLNPARDVERAAARPGESKAVRFAKATFAFIFILIIAVLGFALLVYYAHLAKILAAIISGGTGFPAAMLGAAACYDGKKPVVPDVSVPPAGAVFADDADGVRLVTASNSAASTRRNSDTSQDGAEAAAAAAVDAKKGKIKAAMLPIFDAIQDNPARMGSLLEAAKKVAETLKNEFITAFYDYYSKGETVTLKAKISELKDAGVNDENITKIMAAGYQVLGETNCEAHASAVFRDLNSLPVSTTAAVTAAISVVSVSAGSSAPTAMAAASAASSRGGFHFNEFKRQGRYKPATTSAAAATAKSLLGYGTDAHTPVFMPGSGELAEKFAADAADAAPK